VFAKEQARTGPVLLVLVRNVRHESHETGTLDTASEVTLLLGIKASAAAIIHASMRINVVTKTNDVFVVNVLKASLLVNIVLLFYCFHKLVLI